MIRVRSILIVFLLACASTSQAFVPRGLTQPLRSRGLNWAKSTDWVEIQEQYQYNRPAWDAVLGWLISTNLDNLKPGTYYVSGDSIVAKIQEAKTRRESKIEAHIRYVDLQWTFSGTERYEVYSPRFLESTDAYNAKKDVQHFAVRKGPKIRGKKIKKTYISDPQTIFLFFPDQPHKALLVADTLVGPEPIRKVVVKIPYVSGELKM